MSYPKVVIYCRYSSDMQRPESCEDQEREVRAGLLRAGVDPADAVVIYDRAESGTKAFREAFRRLGRMIAAKEVAVLAVDDQSRLSRSENAFAFVRDLVYAGGRFVSTGEGIDTRDRGWELKVKVLELANGEAIRGLQDKVRRGQRGRVLADDSAGDFPYGYESYYKDADWQQQLARRGPKPKKGLRVNEDEARWVRQIFTWFVGGRSVGGIARELTAAGAPKGRRASTRGWHPQQVHRVLNNPKYVGSWSWGKTTTIRNSAGRKKQVAATADGPVVRDRPDLRIVDQAAWDLTRIRLAALAQTFGYKAGQARRGPKPPADPAAVYPRSMLGGVLTCAACGSAMWYRGSGGRRYYACSGYKKNVCDAGFQVPAAAAETAVIDALTTLVAGWPEWVADVHAQVRGLIVDGAAQVPEERGRDERRLGDVRRQVANLVDAVSNGGHMSPAIAGRLAAAEREAAEIEERLAASPVPTAGELALPDEAWVRAQLAGWSDGLADPAVAGRAIREAVDRITAEPVVYPGKKRGSVLLRVHYHAWEAFMALAGDRLPPAVRRLLPDPACRGPAATVDLALGEPTAMDRWTPDIVRWRGEGVIWKEIVARTGLDLNRVYRAWKRFQEANKSA